MKTQTWVIDPRERNNDSNILPVDQDNTERDLTDLELEGEQENDDIDQTDPERDGDDL